MLRRIGGGGSSLGPTCMLPGPSTIVRIEVSRVRGLLPELRSTLTGASRVRKVLVWNVSTELNRGAVVLWLKVITFPVTAVTVVPGAIPPPGAIACPT